MMTYLILFVLLVFSQLFRFSIVGNLEMMPLDIGIWFFILINYQSVIRSLKNFKISRVYKIITVFFTFSLIYLFIFVNFISFSEKIYSSLYLLRLIGYLLFFNITILKSREDNRINKFITRLVLIFPVIIGILGLMQLVFYPDLRNLIYLGWDPHFGRLFSVILDPNYTGLILAFGLILHIYEAIKNKKLFSLFGIIILILTLLLSLSRSSYLAFLIGIIYFSIKIKKYLIPVICSLIFVIFLILYPKPVGEGGKLERSSTVSARVNNYQKYIDLYLKNPIFGYGYNTIKYLNTAKNNLVENKVFNHANSGIDNSFLYIAVTTGLLGLMVFLYLIFYIMQWGNPLVNSITLTLCVHSFFQNSWFFPQILVYYLLILVIYNHSFLKKNR